MELLIAQGRRCEGRGSRRDDVVDGGSVDRTHVNIVGSVAGPRARKSTQRTPIGSTALMSAAFGGYTDAVNMLLAHGANMAVKDSQGRTALMAAAIQGNAGPVQALIAKGADVEAADSQSQTPLVYAAGGGTGGRRQRLIKGGAGKGWCSLTWWPLQMP